MKGKVPLTCDVCGEPITEGHQKYYYATVVVNWRDKDTGGETNEHRDEYHAHNDFSKRCMRKLWTILEKHRPE